VIIVLFLPFESEKPYLIYAKDDSGMQGAPALHIPAVWTGAMGRDVERIARELLDFQGGVTDTSTLIYLERLGKLELAAHNFSLWIIPQVVEEYGAVPCGIRLPEPVLSGPTDAVLCHVAQLLAQPVLSEDKQVLRNAQRRNIPHYNTLMIILALYARGMLTTESYDAVRLELPTFARYSPQVFAVGDAVFQALRQGRHHKK
jgi:hypothetical protein